MCIYIYRIRNEISLKKKELEMREIEQESKEKKFVYLALQIGYSAFTRWRT